MPAIREMYRSQTNALPIDERTCSREPTLRLLFSARQQDGKKIKSVKAGWWRKAARMELECIGLFLLESAACGTLKKRVYGFYCHEKEAALCAARLRNLVGPDQRKVEALRKEPTFVKWSNR
jgi:hypothetical protein